MADPTTPDTPLSPEIAKLTEKLAKDPKSRLFVPLAEEYLKVGMLDEALMVLNDGLKIHPNFLSAKATLGKVFFEKGETARAKEVFEEVVGANPDNLLAHRRLSRMYKDEGALEEARASCQAVLNANPKDPEMKALLDEVESLLPVQDPAISEIPEEEKTEALLETTSVSGKNKSSDAPTEGAPGATAMDTDVTGEIRASEPSPSPTVPDETAPGPASPAPSGSAAADPEHEVSGPSSQEPRIEKPEPSPPASPAGEPAPQEDDISTESLADLYIKQGFYDRGLEIYRKILSRDPSREPVRRKLEETEALMAILAKNEKTGASTEDGRPAPPADVPKTETRSESPSSNDKVRRLEAWLESIRKGQDR